MGRAAVTQTAEHAWFEREVIIGVCQIAKKMQSHDGFHGLIVDNRRDRNGTSCTRWDDDGVAVYLDLGLGMSSGFKARIPQERVVKIVVVVIDVFELR